MNFIYNIKNFLVIYIYIYQKDLIFFFMFYLIKENVITFYTLELGKQLATMSIDFIIKVGCYI